MDNNKAYEIVAKLTLFGHEAYFAGGAVRDTLMDKEPSDIDIATSATPEDVKDIFENVKFVGDSFGVSLVTIEDESFEVATFRSESDYSDGRHPDSVDLVKDVFSDASRRDLTINALYLSPVNGKVLDFFEGRKDIKEKRIRFVGKPEDRIKEDNLRIIRAIRFASILDFEIVEEDMKAIRKNAFLIENVSPERIKAEFDKAFEKGCPARFISLLWSSGALYYILPEVSELQLVEQDPHWHPEGDVFTHTIKVLKLLKEESSRLKWAALFHDVGKTVKTKLEDGKIRSKGHDKASDEMALEIMKRLRFSNEEIEEISYLVKNHMKPLTSNKMKLSKLKRLVNEGDAKSLARLARADMESTSRKDLDYSGILRLEEVIDMPKETNGPDPILNGKDLIALGYKPGVIFKEILEYIYDEQLEGNITNKDQAIEMVVKQW